MKEDKCNSIKFVAQRIALGVPFSAADIYELMRCYEITEDEMTEVCSHAAKAGTTPSAWLFANNALERSDEVRPPVKYKHVKEWSPQEEPPETEEPRKLCPFIVSHTNVQPCLKELCALYMDKANKCAIWLIASKRR